MSFFQTIGGMIGSVADFFVFDYTILIPILITILVILWIMKSVNTPWDFIFEFGSFVNIIAFAIIAWLIYLVLKVLGTFSKEAWAMIVLLLVIGYAVYIRKGGLK